MKYKVLKLLANFRRFANTNRGEKIVVKTLTGISVILMADIVLFVFGSINQ